MKDILKLRNEIDTLDSKLMNILDKRFTIAKKIGKIKKQNNIQKFDKNREKEILSKTNSSTNKAKIKIVFKKILEEAKK